MCCPAEYPDPEQWIGNLGIAVQKALGENVRVIGVIGGWSSLEHRAGSALVTALSVESRPAVRVDLGCEAGHQIGVEFLLGELFRVISEYNKAADLQKVAIALSYIGISVLGKGLGIDVKGVVESLKHGDTVTENVVSDRMRAVDNTERILAETAQSFGSNGVCLVLHGWNWSSFNKPRDILAAMRWIASRCPPVSFVSLLDPSTNQWLDEHGWEWAFDALINFFFSPTNRDHLIEDLLEGSGADEDTKELLRDFTARSLDIRGIRPAEVRRAARHFLLLDRSLQSNATLYLLLLKYRCNQLYREIASDEPVEFSKYAPNELMLSEIWNQVILGQAQERQVDNHNPEQRIRMLARRIQ
jgi:hypothetical protein